MRYRIAVDECSDKNRTWHRYYPEYKHWWNIFWRRWYDPFYGWADGYDKLEDAIKFINEQKRRNSYRQKKVEIINQ